MSTLLNIFELKHFLIGYHICHDATDDYIINTSRNSYNCLVKQNLLKTPKCMIALHVINSVPKIVIIEPEGVNLDTTTIDPNEQLKLPSTSTIIKIQHENFNITSYQPHTEVQMTKNLNEFEQLFYDVIKDVQTNNVFSINVPFIEAP